MKRARRPTNRSLDPTLVDEARALSEVTETALRVATARRERWLAENEKAISDSNAFVERNGVFNEDERGW